MLFEAQGQELQSYIQRHHIQAAGWTFIREIRSKDSSGKTYRNAISPAEYLSSPSNVSQKNV